MRVTRVQILLLLIISLTLACAAPNDFPPIPVSATLPAPITLTSVPPTDAIPLPLVDSPQLAQFYFIDENNGWGATETQLIRTNDGGVTWYDASPHVDTQFGYAPYLFIDAQSAWVLISSSDYQTGTLYQTYDGGITWDSIAVPFGGASMQMLDAENGFALAALGAGAGSEAVALFKTTDAGHTWTRVFINDPTVDGSNNSLPLGGQKGGFAFINESTGWVGGSIPMDNYIYLYQTTDGGETWSEANLALPVGYESAQTSNDGPQFFSATEGILAVSMVMGGDPGVATVVYRTSDGGVIWSAGEVIAHGRPSDFRSFSEGVAWGGGPFQVTHDAGQSWSTIQPDVDFSASLVSFQFITSQIGFTLIDPTGSDHTLYKTTDGGATWTVLIP